MEIRELEYFVAIWQEENLSRAAEKLFVTQPALSRYLQRLEDELGLPLFQRIGRRMRLTYAGERYLAYAQQILQTRREMEAEMTDIRREEKGRLRVGIPPFRCSFIMPAVLPAFRSQHPNIDVEIMEEASAVLDEALACGDIDLAFFSLSEKNTRLNYEILEEDRLYVILPKGHPLGSAARTEPDGARSLTLEQLADETLILQKHGQRQGQYILSELSARHIRPRKTIESTNIRAAALLAANGYGAAFLSGGLLRHFEARERCDAFRLSGCKASLNFAAATRAGSYVSSWTGDFIALVREGIRSGAI